jgi:D-ribulokinase
VVGEQAPCGPQHGFCYERLAELGAERSGSVITVGGGARSAVWSRIRATVLGDEVAVAVDAGTATGARLLAAAGWLDGRGA